MSGESYKAPFNEDLYIHKDDEGKFQLSVNFATFADFEDKEDLINYFEECISITRNM